MVAKYYEDEGREVAKEVIDEMTKDFNICKNPFDLISKKIKQNIEMWDLREMMGEYIKVIFSDPPHIFNREEKKYEINDHIELISLLEKIIIKARNKAAQNEFKKLAIKHLKEMD